MYTKRFGFIVAVLGLLAVSVYAEDQKTTDLSKKDRDFVQAAAGGGMMEVRLGQLAQKQASSQDVKDFGKKMVEDHTKANKELESLAKGKGVDLDKNLDQAQKDEIERMSKLNGADFDKAYMSMMVKDHEEDVNEFTNGSNHLSDPDLKDFATRTLPTLQDHLKMAKDIKNNLEK